MNNLIKTLDLDDFINNGLLKETFVEELKTIFETTGFFFIKNHHIPEELFYRAKSCFKEFFITVPVEERLQYEYKDLQHQVGYTPMRLETGEYAKDPDEKHFFQVGDHLDLPEVKEVDYFTPTCSELYNAFKNLSITLLCAVALSLKLPEHYFDNKEGDSIMRAIHYPSSENPLVDDGLATEGGNITGMCASKHTDINIITLLEAKEPGLELWYKNEWIPITIEDPNVLIVNCGDMLQHLTGGRYISGLHRVICEKNTDRFSVPYFCHIHGEESISPLEHLGKSDTAKFYFKTAGQFLNHRLEQIKL